MAILADRDIRSLEQLIKMADSLDPRAMQAQDMVETYKHLNKRINDLERKLAEQNRKVEIVRTEGAVCSIRRILNACTTPAQYNGIERAIETAAEANDKWLSEQEPQDATVKMKLFAITTLREDSPYSPGGIDTRTVGIFDQEDIATRILENDVGDLNEAGYHPWAVIEQIETGLYPQVTMLQCYEYNKGWKPVELPQKIKEYLEQIVRFCSVG